VADDVRSRSAACVLEARLRSSTAARDDYREGGGAGVVPARQKTVEERISRTIPARRDFREMTGSAFLSFWISATAVDSWSSGLEVEQMVSLDTCVYRAVVRRLR
jgi:hypothetical protein